MSKLAQSFITHLDALKERDRGAFAHLKRSLAFSPGAYPPAYPYVERFVGPDKHAEDPWRKAMYLAAGLFALNPQQLAGVSFASAFGKLGRARESSSIEQRFIALLGAEAESLPNLLRQATSLLSTDGLGCDYAALLTDLARWLHPLDLDNRDRLRQRWARDFYRTYEPYSASAGNTETQHTETQL